MLAAVDTAIIEIAGGGIVREEEEDFPGHVCSSQSEGWRGELFRVGITRLAVRKNKSRLSPFQHTIDFDTTESGAKYVFCDATGDTYTVRSLLQGRQYVDYMSDQPNVISVTASLDKKVVKFAQKKESEIVYMAAPEAACRKQKPTLGAWPDRYAKIEDGSLNFYELTGGRPDTLKGPRGSSIGDLRGCRLHLGQEKFTFDGTQYLITLERRGHATLPDLDDGGISRFCFKQEADCDAFASAHGTPLRSSSLLAP